jgi:hypothetical protein
LVRSLLRAGKWGQGNGALFFRTYPRFIQESD